MRMGLIDHEAAIETKDLRARKTSLIAPATRQHTGCGFRFSVRRDAHRAILVRAVNASAEALECVDR